MYSSRPQETILPERDRHQSGVRVLYRVDLSLGERQLMIRLWNLDENQSRPSFATSGGSTRCGYPGTPAREMQVSTAKSTTRSRPFIL